ncbi:PadR family transcriptional regulator [Fructobacillus sp. M1-13]|uniref:PadR family transcriptional regulator n=1 Tax=Fructobacillus papyriferae TaxID=2713171 RepID=A0ABS5QN20_9LACO|nr:PadR family transcriptional regulator [Fructobacillus papyriferae]MBS9334479.1 PadR family transcriptional regulator [Fructobacillus papyriferae]MCD2158468.1 PadR family transcriptional regulator [Fructobacillus papyriferae]
MAIKVPNQVLEAVVLEVLINESLYGYALTKKIQTKLKISDSTTYPVLRRLEKAGFVSTRSAVFAERIRKYYQVTDLGQRYLDEVKADWRLFASQINDLLGE